jgi:O-antigen/teichoic acid export membrane protein
MFRNGFPLILSLMLTSILANRFEVLEYGLYKYVLSIIGMFSFLTLPAINQVLLKEIARSNHGYMKNVLRYRLRGSILYTFAVLILAAYYYLFGEIILTMPLVVVGSILPLATCFDSYQHYLLGRQKYSHYSFIPIIISVSSTIVVSAIAYISGDVVNVLIALSGSQLILNISAYIYTIKIFPPNVSDTSKNTNRFGLQFSFIAILGTVSSYSAEIVTGIFLSFEDVALLSMILFPLRKSKVFTKAIQDFITPKILNKRGAQLAPSMTRAIIIFTSLSIIVALILAIAIPWMYKLFFPLYMNTVYSAQVIMISIIIGAPLTMMEISLLAQEKIKQIAAFNIFGTVSSFVIMGFCLYVWGVDGIVVSRVISVSIRLLFIANLYRRNMPSANAKIKAPTKK